MKYEITFWAREKYLPTKRHRKLRERQLEHSVTVNVKELTNEQFPVAFIVHDFHSVYDGAVSYDDFDGHGDFRMISEEIRTYQKKLYKPVRVTHGAAVSTIFENLNYIKNQLEDRAPSWKDGEDFTEKSIVVDDDTKDWVKCIRQKAKKYLIHDGKVYEECGEPMYNITTFGLGHNHGGTGFFIAYDYNPNISSDHYFSALEREEAIAYGKSVAARRGDTDSIAGMGEHDMIEVLMPELVKRNPHKEHGKGCSLINSIESMIEGTDSSMEAGLLAMAMTMVSLKEREENHEGNQYSMGCG